MFSKVKITDNETASLALSSQDLAKHTYGNHDMQMF